MNLYTATSTVLLIRPVASLKRAGGHRWQARGHRIRGGGVVGQVLRIRGGVVGEVLRIRGGGGGSRRGFTNSRVGEVLHEFEGGVVGSRRGFTNSRGGSRRGFTNSRGG